MGSRGSAGPFDFFEVLSAMAPPPVVLDPDRAEFFVTQVNGQRGLAWQQDTRRSLRQIGQIVNPQGWPAEPKRLGSAGTAAPYSADVQQAWLLAGDLCCRAGRPDEAWVPCASIGMGLSGPEAAAASPSDLVDLGGGRVGMWVAGRNARLVPLRTGFDALALQAGRAVGGGRFVAEASRNAVHKTAARIVVEGVGSFSFRRGRSSWLAAHLVAGTPLAALRVIAGPLSMRTLDNLVESSCEGLDSEAAALQGLRA